MSTVGKEWFQLGDWGRQYMKDFGVNGRSGGGLMWMTLMGGKPTWRVESRVGLTSTLQIETRGIEVILRSAESLLDTRDKGRRKKEGVCQEDTWVQGIPFEMGYLLTPVSLLQVYFVLIYWTSHELYLYQEGFVQRLILSWSSSLLNYKFYPTACLDILGELYNETGGRRLYQPGTISWGHLGLIKDSLNDLILGQVNNPVVLEDVVDTYDLG